MTVTQFRPGELRKFCLLGIIFSFILGIYWFLRPIKDGVFVNIIGADYLPVAQLASLFAIVPVLAGYSKLVDLLPRHKLFYVLAALFGFLSLGFTFFLVHSTCEQLCEPPSFGLCLLALAFYVYVKIFGSVMVALFWAFVADTTTPDAAKRGYTLIVGIGQLGNICGSLLVNRYAETLGAGLLSLLSVVAIFGIIPLIYFFIRTVPSSVLVGYRAQQMPAKKPKVGMFEGFWLLISQPYLFGIFSTIAIYEVVQAVFDFRFKTLASSAYQGNGLIAYFGYFGAITGVFALLWLLLGIDRIARNFGLTRALVTFPALLIVLIAVNSYPSLTIAMWVMVLTRALNYALNQPSKEQLYIATTKETKYKAKAWIEVFGTRTTEAFAQTINMLKQALGSSFLPFGSVVTLAAVTGWLFLARYLGKSYTDAVEKDEFVC